MYEYKPGIPAVFYRLADKTTGVMQAEGSALSMPEGAVQISQEEWTAGQNALAQARQARERTEREARQAAASAAYTELKALGVSEASARMMSGYTGD